MESQKRKVVKAELDQHAITLMLEMHIKKKIPFELIASNYTSEIVSDLIHIKYMNNAKSSQAFAAFSMVQSDVGKHPLPDVDTKYLKYYQTNFKYDQLYADKLYNIDLKSAYSAILFNEGYLSQKTFDFLSRCPKQDRLAAVGMLAGRKHKFVYNANGEQTSFEEIINPLGKFFFHAVRRTYEIMDMTKLILQDSFAFAWVDSVYYTDAEKTSELQQMISKDYNLKTSFSILTEFDLKTIEQRNRKYYYLSFIKDGEAKTNWSIPYPEKQNRQYIYDYLLNRNK